jgi:hypothetical protein
MFKNLSSCLTENTLRVRYTYELLNFVEIYNRFDSENRTNPVNVAVSR